jgi:ATP-binding cassette subfamily B protein
VRLIARFLRRYAAPFWPYYLLGFAMLGLTNYAVVRIPVLIGSTLNIVSEAGAGALDAATSEAQELMIWASLLVVVRTLSRTLFFNPGRDIQFRIMVDLFGHMLTLPRPFFVRRKIGELVSVASNDTQSVRLLVGFAALQVCNVAVAIPMHVGQMLATDPVLTAWCASIVLVGGVHIIWTVRRFYTLVRESLERLAQLSERVLESYSGISTIRSHSSHDAAVARFNVRNAAYRDVALKIAWIRAFAMPLLALAGLTAATVVLWVGGRRVAEGVMNVGDLATFAALLTSLAAILYSLAWVLTSISRGVVALGRVDSLLVTEPDVAPGADSLELDEPPTLELDDLSFSYEASEVGALQGVSASVRAGGTLGIFGKTGAGKTTLIELLARVHEPPPGAVKIAGRDVRSFALPSYRSALAVVPQTPFLFSTTLRDNVRMLGERTGHVDPGASVHAEAAAEDPRLDTVLDSACMGPDLAQLPEGVETIVGERGVMLSGGQRQRTALARALYREARVLLLDDVLSAVDQHTEVKLVDAIRALGTDAEQRPTTVIVSHRTSVLEHADEILVLEDGRVLDRGTHSELIAREGPYAEAHAHQSQEGADG